MQASTVGFSTGNWGSLPVTNILPPLFISLFSVDDKLPLHSLSAVLKANTSSGNCRAVAPEPPKTTAFRCCPFVTLQSPTPGAIIIQFTSRSCPAMECPHCHRQTGLNANNCGSCGGSIPPAQRLLEE